MFSTINKALINIIPYLPITFIKLFSNRYIAGTTIHNALKTVEKVNEINLSATIDILGEHTKSIDKANKITDEYINLYKQIKLSNLDCNISIKPSHIGSDINLEYFEKNINKIHSQAIKTNNFLRLDMENSSLTDLTINTFNQQYKIKDNIGIVIQAYLYRSMEDIRNLGPKTNIRLCKGIYKENSNICIKEPDDVNQNYISLFKEAIKKNIYIGIATHDKNLIEIIRNIIKENNIKNNLFEFQVLYGVPMGKIIKSLLKDNFKVRVYIPYGEEWYNYSIRRMKENPNLAGYILMNLFKKNFYK